jgi:shikimate kinase
MTESNNIFLIGPMGAGKSTVGIQLAKRLGLDFYDTDQELEQRTGVDLAWIFSVEGEDGFRRRERLIIEDLTQVPNIVLSTGGSCIVDPDNRRNLRNNGFVVYLTTSTPEQFNRTQRNRKRRPELQVPNLAEHIQQRMTQFGPLFSEIADLTILTDHKTVTQVVTEILQHLPKWLLQVKQGE